MENDLNRFLTAQEHNYEIALAEIKLGKKESHWMWYVFPQLRGLGLSDTSFFYGIQDLEEAKAYLAHPLLGPRLVAITNALLLLNEKDAYTIFGSPDHLKLKSCMTLFSLVDECLDGVFKQVLDCYFNGGIDDRTLAFLNR
ncbi:DUF1810 domain-containing protein [Flavobacterium aciduliphilum]|uniref:Uncharacterized protein (DUF1810 family) n=1 Tax=Flavobacterium aciduliphilum TaxID=1101402 RepID=A0A328YHX6_9FLAO|nr:DUF1810 domain-containing protein [Flavobacterium aciduliphilum]RAR73698.1 uncharacterized protein (DUF1810 family) [Flavobacterium aciduliphilum]